jgi:hypothetical protein
MARFSRRTFWRSVLALGFSGCGTILHPERRGQPAGPLDWSIVALDAVGLLLFFVPGVIAFAVDFSNGTIYLPQDSYGRTDREGGLIALPVPGEQAVTVRMLEEVVSARVGRDVRLVPGGFRTRTLAGIDEFWAAREALAAQEA